MSWVRIDVGAKSDPKFGRFAKTLKVRPREALGLFVAVLLELPCHARDGNLSDVDDDMLESWAGWHGKRGTFADAFRAEFMHGTTVSGWEKHNGAPMRQADAEAERKRQLRAKGKDGTPPEPDGDVLPDVPRDIPRDNSQTSHGMSTVRDVTGRDGSATTSLHLEKRCSTSRDLADVLPDVTARVRARQRRGIA